MKDALYVKQRYEQTKCEGEVDTSKTNAFTYVKIGNLIENLENTKYIYLDICVDMYIERLKKLFHYYWHNFYFTIENNLVS